MKRSEWSPRLFAAVLLATAAVAGAPATAPAAQAAADPTTAWSGGTFGVDAANVVRRSNIVLGRPPFLPRQSMNLGNGSFGVAVWAANGLTAQLNRVDTLPNRRNVGQLVVPGLAAMTSAPDYDATVDLYDARYRQSGGGMTATTYVRADKDELVIDVTGVDPESTQTATIDLQSGRNPVAAATGGIATLSETWVDDATYTGPNKGGNGSGLTFGSLAALTAGGRELAASSPAARTIRVTFKPNADGSFRIVVGVPKWTGGDAAATATSLLGTDATAPAGSLSSAHLDWWHSFWGRAGLVKLSSADGFADYMENLRTIYLYTAASSARGEYPSTQAGVNPLFNFSRDTHQWGGGDYWFWNLRMQLATNISAGLTELNETFFELYRKALPTMASWTRLMWPLSHGICLSETMRFDGSGWYIDGGTGNNACDTTSGLSYNKLTITTGAELASWIWRQYQATDDRAFLERYYPLIAESTKFLLFYAKEGPDGKLHTDPTNAHETQWAVHDAITDIAAMKMVFPIAIEAAQTLGVDAGLVTQLQAAIPKILDFPRADKATQRTLKSPADDGDGATVLGFSYDPGAQHHNVENLGLEPVWPYNLISDTSPLFNLAKETYNARLFRNSNSWTWDPVQAARLGLADQVVAGLRASTNSFQAYPSGLAAWNTSSLQEPYDEQVGVTSLAINESLATDFDGLLRLAPALPDSWDAEGTVHLQHRSKVHVQVKGGTVTTAVIQSGADHAIRLRNPWPGQEVQVVDGTDGTTVVVPTTQASTISIPAKAGKSYIVQQPSAPVSGMPVAPISGTPAKAARHLPNSQATIGLDPPPPPPCQVPAGQTVVTWDPEGGDSIRDWSDYGRTGTFLRAPTYADEGPTNSAVALSGGNYITGGATKLGFLREVTLATEIKITPGSGVRRIWDWKTSAGGNGDGIVVDLAASGALRVITAGQAITVNPAIPTGRWLDLVVTIGVDGVLNVYVDGARVGGGTFNAPGINGCADGASLRLGADQAGGQSITASVDRAAIFTKALSVTDVTTWQQLAFVEYTNVEVPIGGVVPTVLGLNLGPAAGFGSFLPGVNADYTTSIFASVTSTAGSTALTVSDRTGTAPGRLVNGAYALPSALQARIGASAFAAVGADPLTLHTYTGPVSNDNVAVDLKQSVRVTDGLRSGRYSKTLTFTLSASTP